MSLSSRLLYLKYGVYGIGGSQTYGFDPDSPDLEQFVRSPGMEQICPGLENLDLV